MPEDHYSSIPTWNGDPAAFEAFVTACKWYTLSLKESERKQAASRVWQKLQGAAKSVVRHLDPMEYDAVNGLDKLIEVLRESPLQRLPVPDSFTRLEKWSGMRRGANETIPQLLVREEELFTELQQALQRARAERIKTTSVGAGTSAREREPPTSPSRSPTGPGMMPEEDADSNAERRALEADFFGDELRGYRLLKASRLSSQEKQHILTLTNNSTRFVEVRRALRTLFADESMDDGQQRQRQRVWFHDGECLDGRPRWVL